MAAFVAYAFASVARTDARVRPGSTAMGVMKSGGLGLRAS